MFLNIEKEDKKKRLSKTAVESLAGSPSSISKSAGVELKFQPYLKFRLKNIYTYETFSSLELQALEGVQMSEDDLKELVVSSMKLCFIYYPLIEVLLHKFPNMGNSFQVQIILQMLLEGDFYQYLPSNPSQLTFLINNRTTSINTKIVIAGILAFASKKMKPDQISNALLLFTLEQALYGSAPNGIPADNQKIIKALKKIERVIKPSEYKIWIQNFRSSSSFKGYLEPHHFLYLASMSEKKNINGLSSLIFKSKSKSTLNLLQSNFKDIKQFEENKMIIRQIQEKEVQVRGLSFCQHSKPSFFAKNILVDFRKNNPIKGGRPESCKIKHEIHEDIGRRGSISKITLDKLKSKNNLLTNQNRKNQEHLKANIQSFMKKYQDTLISFNKMKLNKIYKSQLNKKMLKIHR